MQGSIDGLSPAEHARALAARRKVVLGSCAVCGKAFTGTRKRRYCSHTCAALASYRRRSGQKSPVDQLKQLSPEPLQRLDRVRDAIMGGRRFADDSAEILRQAREMTVDKEHNRRPPPSPAQLERRRKLAARILTLREQANIAPLTTAELIRQVRDEELAPYGRKR